MDDRQALANEILQTALAECVAPRQKHHRGYRWKVATTEQNCEGTYA